MTEQMTLESWAAKKPPVMNAIAEKFEEFHRENPHVYEYFRQYSLQALDRGYDRFSAKAVFERLRWHFQMETKGEEFKLNNNYTAYYARLLMKQDERFKNFFELRERTLTDKHREN